MATPDPDAVAFAAYASASLDISQAHVTTANVLTLVRSVRDIDANQKRKFLYTLPLDARTATTASLPPQELSTATQLRLPSPSGNHTAVFQYQPDTTLLEIYRGPDLVHRISLPVGVRHGSISSHDPLLGDPRWHPDETMLVYGAERLVSKHSKRSFFTKQSDESDDTETQQQDETAAATTLHTNGRSQEPWGEGYADLRAASLMDFFTVDIATGTIHRVRNVPPDKLLGQAVFVVDGTGTTNLVYTAWDATLPRRLGLTHCSQRPSQLYRSSLMSSTSPPVLLTPDARLSHSPRTISNTGKIVYLTSIQGFATHQGCWALAILDVTGTSSSRILVDVVYDPITAQRSKSSVLGLPFPGLYYSLPTYAVTNDDTVWLTTQWGSCTKVVRIALGDGSITQVPLGTEDASSSDQVLYADSTNGIVCASSRPHTPSTEIYHIAVEEDGGWQTPRHITSLGPMAVSSLAPLPTAGGIAPFTYEILTTRVPKVQGSDIENPMQSILLIPPTTTEAPPPLIVVPHGGPHGVASTQYMPTYAYLCGHGGYAVLFVNYRGSTGFGQGSLELLPGKIGSLDVADVLAATDAAQERLGNGSKVVTGICGGSHGGFLTAHLSARYPERFQAAVLRNPVVNLPSMVTATDIPDWCYVEGIDGTYHWDTYRPPTAEELQSMYNKSPIQYVSQVKVPTMMALGMKDLRVPPSQGLEWYYCVRALNGVPTQLQVYEDDVHAIDQPASEADLFVHIKKWFDKYLQVPEIPAQ